jgi:hypothetical protein
MDGLIDQSNPLFESLKNTKNIIWGDLMIAQIRSLAVHPTIYTDRILCIQSSTMSYNFWLSRHLRISSQDRDSGSQG